MNRGMHARRPQHVLARPQVFVLGISAGVLASAGGGCVTADAPPRQAPMATPTQPSGLSPDRVALTANRILDDTDRNGYFDTITAPVFLFDSTYPLSIEASGAFTFRLLRVNSNTNSDSTSATDKPSDTPGITQPPTPGEELAVWTFSSQQAEGFKRKFDTGVGYSFRLNLLELGTDRLGVTTALLECSFTRPDGRKIVSRSRVTVTVGRT